ncbi:unnamed protein product [Knipowitschia caucasica]|uniref:Uncharacterized protein n=1 Tax=Knipowitschia caucasica TaxID=637954 RepID=A0AAV2LHD0_KNICA
MDFSTDNAVDGLERLHQVSGSGGGAEDSPKRYTPLASDQGGAELNAGSPGIVSDISESTFSDDSALSPQKSQGYEADHAPAYYSYWTPPVYNPTVIDSFLTPSSSPQPRLTGTVDFLEIVKACVASAVRVVVLQQIKEDCFGCQISHPSQRQHACLYPPVPWFFSANFERLMGKVLTWEFVPALKNTLTKTGLDILEARVEGAADAFLYDLKNEENILEKVNEITCTYTTEKSEDLLDHFLSFWNP